MPHTCYTVFINHVGALPESEPVNQGRVCFLARLLLADYGATQYLYGFDVAGTIASDANMALMWQAQ